MAADWWTQNREIQVVVDNDSWILPFAEALVLGANQGRDSARLVRSHSDIESADITFFLGCIKITPDNILKRSKRNLVVHASDLPQGRGFSPMTWRILEGENELPVTLFEAVTECDAGDILDQLLLKFTGTELLPELQQKLGEATLSLAIKYLNSESCPVGMPQQGEASVYPRRYPKDSELDINKSLLDNFNLLRTVDNEKYPAFFHYGGEKFQLKIEKIKE